MPRMHVWLAGATTTAVASYISYYHVYLPRTTIQNDFESKLVIQNHQLQQVMQTYAQLMATVEQARTRAVVLSKQQQSIKGSGPSSSPRKGEMKRKEDVDNIDYEMLIAGGSVPASQTVESSLTVSSPEVRSLPSPAQSPVAPPAPPLSSSPEKETGEGVAQPIFYTNRDKLLVYLTIQKLRGMLFRLPKTAQQTEQDKTAMLSTLDRVEQECLCTGAGHVVVSGSEARLGEKNEGAERVVSAIPPLNGLLNFRDAPLAIAQQLRCLAGYLLYVFAFRAVPLLLSWCPFSAVQLVALGASPSFAFLRVPHYLRRDSADADVSDGDTNSAKTAALVAYRLHMLYHVFATVILRLLEVEVDLEISEASPSFDIPYVGNDAANPGRSVVGAAAVGDSDGTVASYDTRYVVMNPTHWIEEVGFWACQQNPLLLPPSFLPTCDCVKVKSPGARNGGEGEGGWTVIGRDGNGFDARNDDAATAADTGDRNWSRSVAQSKNRSAKYALRVLSVPSVSFIGNLCSAEARAWWCTSFSAATQHSVGASLSPSSVRYLLSLLLHTQARPTACAFPLDYGVLWQKELEENQQAEKKELLRLSQHAALLRGSGVETLASGKEIDGVANAKEVPSASPSLSRTSAAAADRFIVCHGRSSFGYPLAVDTAALHRAVEREHSKADAANPRSHSSVPRFVPVGVAGLPRLLYADDAVAKLDCAPRRSSSGIYEHLSSDQFGHAPQQKRRHNSAESQKALSGSQYGVSHSGNEKNSDRALATARRLTLLQQQRSVPLLDRLWWGSVYGGSSRGGRATRRVLCYRFGQLSDSENLAEGMLEVTEAAVRAAYPEEASSLTP